MPCDIGYKSYTRVRIPEPTTQKFKQKLDAPSIDADLLEKLGIDDPTFLEWAEELDIKPLLREALKRARGKTDVNGDIRLMINDAGQLVASARYRTPGEGRSIERQVGRIYGQFQFEVLGVVAELLGYEFVIKREISPDGETFTLEGEKHDDAHVHRYLRVKRAGDEAELVFEHFDSKESLEKESDKFVALAQKLGVKLDLGKTRKSGQPIPTDAVHRHFLKH